jgi:hypothetical protein
MQALQVDKNHLFQHLVKINKKSRVDGYTGTFKSHAAIRLRRDTST